MGQKQKQKQKSGGARKIGRNKRHQATLYVSGDRWNKNRKRAMRRHLRSHPFDKSTSSAFEQRYGKVESIGLTALGKRRLHRGIRQ